MTARRDVTHVDHRTALLHHGQVLRSLSTAVLVLFGWNSALTVGLILLVVL